MEETWRPIPHHERYEVSDLGRVRRVSHSVLKGDLSKGYLRVTLRHRNGQIVRVFVHRLVATAFIGDRPDGYQVNHKDGKRTNNVPDNLEYVTPKENQQHSWRALGRQPPHKGESTHFAKLTDTDAIRIRRMRADGATYKEIASHFNTKPANIWHICMGRTWKHLL